MPKTPPTSPPSAVSRVPLDLPRMPLPGLAVVGRDSVAASGVLMLTHFYVTRLRFFEAVDTARRMLDTDRLWISDKDLLNLLYCWPEHYQRISELHRAQLEARILGIPHPDVANESRDQIIQGLLVRVLNAFGQPDGRVRRRRADEVDLTSAVSAVRSRLAGSVSGLGTMQIRDLRTQLTAATDILAGLANPLHVRRRSATAKGNVWASLNTLVGQAQRTDGVDMYAAAEQARAWRRIWLLLENHAGGPPSKGQRRAAMLLRPAPSWQPGKPGAGLETVR
ncbi:hypothetical protein [Alloactinosynnema sp. L-07]|uniref:hypothetical protein n=1 Tax=Alloactinosynnema sp. L-07 TaxID=1653480 RepID=UPI00065F095B|nr:hypothetical protein [Alloactinosynnema sp. L-07]CRK59230.1 hypothetical protein [Alloactinosynnema sp. L-07]